MHALTQHYHYHSHGFGGVWQAHEATPDTTDILILRMQHDLCLFELWSRMGAAWRVNVKYIQSSLRYTLANYSIIGVLLCISQGVFDAVTRLCNYRVTVQGISIVQGSGRFSWQRCWEIVESCRVFFKIESVQMSEIKDSISISRTTACSISIVHTECRNNPNRSVWSCTMSHLFKNRTLVLIAWLSDCLS